MFKEASQKWGRWGVAAVIFVSTGAMGGGGESGELPRGMGPFTLRMSTAEFQRLTGVTPDTCPVCIEKEGFASLSPREVQLFIPAYDAEEGIDFFFYEDKLYHFTTTPEAKSLFVAQQVYSDRFGRPGQITQRGNDTAAMKWEDTGTVIEVNYRTTDEEVFGVSYYDWDLRAERDWRASMLMEQQGIAAQ